MKKAVLIVLDGCGSDYLQQVKTPFLEEVAKKGYAGEVQAAVPTVTNVNTASLLTARTPADHGITGNSYFDSVKNMVKYMNNPTLILAETLFSRCVRRGITTALLTVKDKLAYLLSTGAQIVVSAENAPEWVMQKLGAPPSVYDPHINLWLLRVLKELLRRRGPLFCLLVTTDTLMHYCSPGSKEAGEFLQAIDNHVGQIMKEDDVDLVVTADHGMNYKDRVIDPLNVLSEEGIMCRVVSTIQDTYERHHLNLAGSCFVYTSGNQSEDAKEILSNVTGIEAVCTKKEAANRFCLHPQRIGDLLLLGDQRTVFTATLLEHKEIRIRSHGSLHETQVPVISSCFPREKFPSHIWEVPLLIPTLAIEINRQENS